LFDCCQQQYPGIRGQPAAIESNMHQLARHRWQTRQNPPIFPMAGANSIGFVDPAVATESDTTPKAYAAPASPLTQLDELFRLIPIVLSHTRR